jgi:hypothetical protein
LIRILVRPQPLTPGSAAVIAEREPDPRMMRVERGDDDLADITGGVAAAGLMTLISTALTT